MMRKYNHSWIMLLAGFLLAACVGCRRGDGSGGSNGPTDPNPDERPVPGEGPNGENLDGTNQALPPEPPPPKTIPEVKLTEEERKKCLAWIDDPLPEGELPDFDGQTHKLEALYGEQLTVVCFWTSGKTQYGRLRVIGMLGDLEKDFAQRYADKGLRVIGIHEGDDFEEAKQQIQDAGAQFSVLLDPGGDYLAEVATEKLPRIYALDAQRKIRWLDTEYSGITREDLHRTIEVVLGEQ